MESKKETSALDNLKTSAEVAKTIQGAVKTGKAVASIAKGAAAGPYGAVAGFLWANKNTVAKALAAISFLMMLPVLFIMMLPSLIFGGLTEKTEISVMNDNAAIISNISEAESTVREALGDSLQSTMSKISTEIEKMNENERGIIVNNNNSIHLNTSLIISQYCAAKTDFREINMRDLKKSLDKAEKHMYSYAKTESSTIDEETKITTTIYTYTINYSGDDYFATNIFKLSEEQRMLANDYAQNLFLFLYGTSYQGSAGSSNVSENVLKYETLIIKYAEQHGIGQFVEVIKALIMQESGGRHLDVMQSSECPLNIKYPNKPGAITDPEYSIDVGIAYFALCLAEAGCTSPSDMDKLSLALQGYNYGNGYISWAIKKYGGYTGVNALEFSNMMKAKLGWKGYGDPEYVPHVLRYYNPYTGVNSSGWGSPFVGLNWNEKVTSEYGYRTDPLTGSTGAFHGGIDIAYPIGTTINAIAEGKVVSVIHSNVGYGNNIIIEHGNGVTSLYAHCSKLFVTNGQNVGQGDKIAEVGKSGRVTGAHLHLTIKLNGELQNPRGYIK